MAGLLRSLIFVPGNNPRFLEKAKGLEADIVCLDLEDSVPSAEKSKARELVGRAMSERNSYNSQLFVRTNSPASGLVQDDLEAAAVKGLDGVVVPKVDDPSEIVQIDRMLATLERKQGAPSVDLIPSIESAIGVMRCFEICTASKRNSAAVFGVFDLLADMGIEYTKNPEGAKYARAKIALDAAAAGIPAIDAIWQDLNDNQGLVEDCRAARVLGYSGKSVIHPGQIQTVHEVFYPTKPEIEWARKVTAAYPDSVESGRGAITVDGKMIDLVHYKQARALLDLVDGSTGPSV